VEQDSKSPQVTSPGLRDASQTVASGSHPTRLPLYATTVLLLTIVVVGLIWLHLRATYRDTFAYWDSNLSNSDDEQVSVGNLWLIERRTDTEALAANPFVPRLLLTGTNSANITETRQRVVRDIQHLASVNGFIGGAVADADCGMVAQTGVPAEALAGVEEACHQAQTSGGFSVAADPVQSSRLCLILAFPVFVAEGTSRPDQESRREVGAAIMLAEPWETVFRFFWKGESTQPATTLIVWKDSADALGFSPHFGNEAVKSIIRLPLTGSALESRVARGGKVEFGEFSDYRGVQVFGVARPFALAGASVVRKVDKDRALADFRKRALLEWLVGALSILLFGSVMATQHRREATRDLQEKIAERKRAEEVLRKLNAELEQRVMERTQQLNVTNRELEVRNNELSASNQELEAFSYSVAHDLRAPLRQIQGFSHLLREGHSPDLAPEAHKYVRNIIEGAQHMGRLIDDLLDLSRVGRQALRLEVRDLAGLVEDARRDLVREVDGRDVCWQIENLPLVECDAALIRQVFVNLISNALKYTQGRQPAVIQIGQAKLEGALVVFVRDNGVGFSMKHVEKLFGVFQRLHRREEFEGTGIGLATVKRIIEKHGGRVWAEAELDKGATFYFTLAARGESESQGETLVTARQALR